MIKCTHHQQTMLGQTGASVTRIANDEGDPGARYYLGFDTAFECSFSLPMSREGMEKLSDMLADFLCDTPTLDGRQDKLRQLIDFPPPCDCSPGGGEHTPTCASLAAGFDASPPVMF